MSLIAGLDYNTVFDKFFNDVMKIEGDIPKRTSAYNWQRALDALTDYINATPRHFLREMHFKDDTLPRLGYPLGTMQGNVIHGAILMDKSVVFFPSQFYKVIEDELKFPSATAIIKDFADNGILDFSPNSPRKYQKQRRLPAPYSRPTWLYVFKAGTLNVSPTYEDNDSEE